MNLSEIDRLGMMRRRHAYFSAVAEEYGSFTDFIKAQDMWLSIMGIGLTDCGRHEYLTVSEIIRWNDDYRCTGYINVITGKSIDKESIVRMAIY